MSAFTPNYNIKVNKKEEVEEDNYISNLLSKTNQSLGQTLSYAIIKEMNLRSSPLNLIQIVDLILPNFENFRKTNGCKYGKNFKKSIISTLHSNKLFKTIDENTFTLNKKEVISYLEKNIYINIDRKKKHSFKKENIDIAMPENNLINNTSEQQLRMDLGSSNDKFLGKKRIEKFLPEQEVYSKQIHCYQILDEMLEKYKNDKQIIKQLSNPCIKCNSADDLILKIQNKDKLIGMLTCFKIFKPLLKKELMIKNKLSYKNFENLSEKIGELKQGIDCVHRILGLSQNE